jgi:hypothetical protein
MKVTSVFIKYLNYARKITWIEFLITLCLVKNSIQISKRKHSVRLRLDSFEKPYKQLELVSHPDIHIRTLETWTMYENTRASRSCFHTFFLVFGYPGETLALVVHILHPAWWYGIIKMKRPSFIQFKNKSVPLWQLYMRSSYNIYCQKTHITSHYTRLKILYVQLW